MYSKNCNSKRNSLTKVCTNHKSLHELQFLQCLHLRTCFLPQCIFCGMIGCTTWRHCPCWAMWASWRKNHSLNRSWKIPHRAWCGNTSRRCMNGIWYGAFNPHIIMQPNGHAMARATPLHHNIRSRSIVQVQERDPSARVLACHPWQGWNRHHSRCHWGWILGCHPGPGCCRHHSRSHCSDRIINLNVILNLQGGLTRWSISCHRGHVWFYTNNFSDRTHVILQIDRPRLTGTPSMVWETKRYLFSVRALNINLIIAMVLWPRYRVICLTKDFMVSSRNITVYTT